MNTPQTSKPATNEVREALAARQSALLVYEGSRRDARAALERYLQTLVPEGITITVQIDDADRDAVRVTATVPVFGQTTSPAWHVRYDRRTNEVVLFGRLPNNKGKSIDGAPPARRWLGRIRGMKAEKALAHLVAVGELEPAPTTNDT